MSGDVEDWTSFERKYYTNEKKRKGRKRERNIGGKNSKRGSKKERKEET
jgi:hypothetical protein